MPQKVLNRLHRALVRAPTAPWVDLRGRRIIVTGAAIGSIGGETARVLASWGADVVITTRSHAEATAARLHPGIEGHPLDLCEPRSVEDFTGWYRETRDDRLDVLVNNAGVHLDLLSRWKEPHRTDDGHEVHWRTNYLGTMHLTSRLLPALEATPGARVVNVVSKLHSRGTNQAVLHGLNPYRSWDAYGTSKLALIHAATELQRRHPGVTANSVHPGAVFTDIATKGLAGHRVLGRARAALAPLERLVLLTAEEGAQTSVFAATAPGLSGGEYLTRCAAVDPSPDAADADVAGRLWEQTAPWIGQSR